MKQIRSSYRHNTPEHGERLTTPLRVAALCLSLASVAAGCGDDGAKKPGAGGGDGGTEQSGDGGGTPPNAGDCSGDEVLMRATGSIDLVTGEDKYELFCHKLPAAPLGVFMTDEYCVKLAADGTGSIDYTGGYDEAPVLVGDDYDRSDTVFALRWGGRVDEAGEFEFDSSYGGVPIHWEKEDGSSEGYFGTGVYWDSASQTLKEGSTTMSRGLPAEGASTAACMFLEPTCITARSEKRCWAEGMLDGDYERYDYMGRLEEKGTYDAGLKSGSWKSFSYRDPETTPYSTHEYIYEAGDETSYGYREYEGDVLTQEGTYTRSTDGSSGYVKQGEWKIYHSATDGSNAPGKLWRLESYDHNDAIGTWTEYAMLYDTNRPSTGYAAVQAWKQTRVATDTCVLSTMDYTAGLRTRIDRGTSICVVDDTCNDPIYMYLYSQTKPEGGATQTCTTPEGAPTKCPTVTCQ